MKINKKIIWLLVSIYFVVSFIILINDQGKGKRFSETLNTITLGLFGQSEEDIIREIGGEQAVQGMKIHQKIKKFAKECQPILESLKEEEKKMCLSALKELKKFETK
jgi:hypothetical protein